jgi:hypothetical protein
MEILEQIPPVIRGLLITLFLVLIWLRLPHTIDVGPGGSDGRLIKGNGESEHDGEVDDGGDSSGCDYSGGCDGVGWIGFLDGIDF